MTLVLVVGLDLTCLEDRGNISNNISNNIININIINIINNTGSNHTMTMDNFMRGENLNLHKV